MISQTEFGIISDETLSTIRKSQDLPGWCPWDKAVDMAGLIIRERPAVVVEIGVFAGRSLIPQAAALRQNDKGFVFGIDPWDDPNSIESWNQGTPLDQLERTFKDAIKHHGLETYVCVIKETSERAVRHFIKSPFSQIDILHIDGCHSEKASTQDVELYLPIVRPGGFIWMDDTDWSTVGNALTTALKSCDLVKDYGKFCLLQKRKDHSSG